MITSKRAPEAAIFGFCSMRSFWASVVLVWGVISAHAYSGNDISLCPVEGAEISMDSLVCVRSLSADKVTCGK